ncbi:MAG: hypothetical protein LWX55_06860 [Deltaproteobacteria bacterium]|nr:hypothetical protein [Deltaproteobacteria bacterium]
MMHSCGSYFVPLPYLDKSICESMDNAYEQIIGQLVKMIQEADKWIIR